jgi:hypothetical protein
MATGSLSLYLNYYPCNHSTERSRVKRARSRVTRLILPLKKACPQALNCPPILPKSVHVSFRAINPSVLYPIPSCASLVPMHKCTSELKGCPIFEKGGGASGLSHRVAILTMKPGASSSQLDNVRTLSRDIRGN